MQHAATQKHTSTLCNAPQHTTTCCNTLQHTATHYITLQPENRKSNSMSCELLTATHCNTPQHIATRCSTMQHTEHFNTSWIHCNTLQHTVTHYNILQHNVTRCNTLQPGDRRSNSMSRARWCDHVRAADLYIGPVWHYIQGSFDIIYRALLGVCRALLSVYVHVGTIMCAQCTCNVFWHYTYGSFECVSESFEGMKGFFEFIQGSCCHVYVGLFWVYVGRFILLCACIVHQICCESQVEKGPDKEE